MKNIIKNNGGFFVGVFLAVAAGLGTVALESHLVAQSALVPVDVAVPPVNEIFQGVGIGLIVLGMVLFAGGSIARIRKPASKSDSEDSVLPSKHTVLFIAGAVALSTGISAVVSAAEPVAVDIAQNLAISAGVLAGVAALLLLLNVGFNRGIGGSTDQALRDERG